ncbi:MAG TPA: carbohydrate ABC transporter permease [Polyangiaceae bacterium]|jgi:multiple sugar transport system permease protein|nr:carbohydrate ABC transporter permease [Polyangiaceae bacterium]
MKALRTAVIALYLVVGCLPLFWLALTAFKHHADTITADAKFLPLPGAAVGADGPAFAPTLEGFVHLAEPHAGDEFSFIDHLLNSIVIGVLSTLSSVALGTTCAYGFSRFHVAGAKDWLFFILSTRFMPPLAVVAPVLIMYRAFDLPNTHLGLIILYTAFNLSLAVWLMKGFIDEIPRAYEESALVDGYSRASAFFRIILPHARTGMAVTAVFCLISAWNEFGFAMTLNNAQAVTVPVYFAGLQGNTEGVPWPQIAAGALVFVAPIVVFTALVRDHLLRGVTFGTIKQ